LYKQFNIDALTLNKAKAEGEGSAKRSNELIQRQFNYRAAPTEPISTGLSQSFANLNQR